LEIAEKEGAALAAPPSADSAAKAKSKFAESRRFIKKKFKTRLFARPKAERTNSAAAGAVSRRYL